jgi:small ligand-binding sensory domain FIST
LGTVGLQTVAAQGCRPVVTVFTVSDADENMIEELDGRPASEVLSDIRGGKSLTAEDKALVETSSILCGLAAPDADTGTVSRGDYLIRQTFGFRVPGFMIGGNARTGDSLHFHVQDKFAAMEDLEAMVGKARTERSFAGAHRAGVPLAALQVSCVARGKNLFGSLSFDLKNATELVGG